MAAPKGNKNASKGATWENALRRALARSGGSVDAGVDKLADKVVAQAMSGDQWALIEIGNRLDGKPTERVEIDATHRTADELTPAQIDERIAQITERIAQLAGGAEAPSAGPPEPPAVH